MLRERTEMVIKPGREAAFHTAMRERGLPLLVAMPGASNVTFGRGFENPDKFLLMLDWESIDAHKAAVTTPGFVEFRELALAYSVSGVMEHFRMN